MSNYATDNDLLEYEPTIKEFGIIDFSDFYPTFAQIAGIDIASETIDGTSFLGVLKGDHANEKSTTLIHYDPKWGKSSKNRNRFSMTNQYKLYQDGRFFNFLDNIDEPTPLENLSETEAETKENLRSISDIYRAAMAAAKRSVRQTKRQLTGFGIENR